MRGCQAEWCGKWKCIHAHVFIHPVSLCLLVGALNPLTFKVIIDMYPGGSDGKESACNAGATGDTGLIPGSGRSPGEGNGNPLQYSCLKNPMNRRAWKATVYGVLKSSKKLSNQYPHTWCFYGKGNCSPLQYSCWEIPMDREAWQTTVHGVSKNQTRLSTCTHTWSYYYFINCFRYYK